MISMTWPEYRRRQCTYRGHRVQLTPVQAEIVSLLLLRPNKVISRAEMYDACWPAPGRTNKPPHSSKVLDIQICMLRKKMPDMPVTTLHSRGFMMERAAA